MNIAVVRVMAGCLLAAGLFYCPAELRGQDPSPRERALQERLIAPCCWSESIAHHRSEVAVEMRVELHRMIEQGKTDREILDAFIAQHGKRVLLGPEGGARAMIYIVPAIAAALGIVLVAWLIHRWARRTRYESPAV